MDMYTCITVTRNRTPTRTRALVCVILISMFFPVCSVMSSTDEGSKTEAKQARKPADGTYEGYCRRVLGMARVKVTIKNGEIADIEIASRFCSPWGRKAFEQMPDRIMESQSTAVDAVTGATYSSGNIKLAVEDALRKAKAARGGCR